MTIKVLVGMGWISGMVGRGVGQIGQLDKNRVMFYDLMMLNTLQDTI